MTLSFFPVETLGVGLRGRTCAPAVFRERPRKIRGAGGSVFIHGDVGVLDIGRGVASAGGDDSTSDKGVNALLVLSHAAR